MKRHSREFHFLWPVILLPSYLSWNSRLLSVFLPFFVDLYIFRFIRFFSFCLSCLNMFEFTSPIYLPFCILCKRNISCLSVFICFHLFLSLCVCIFLYLCFLSVYLRFYVCFIFFLKSYLVMYFMTPVFPYFIFSCLFVFIFYFLSLYVSIKVGMSSLWSMYWYLYYVSYMSVCHTHSFDFQSMYVYSAYMYFYFCKCNFLMTPHAHPLVGWSVCHNRVGSYTFPSSFVHSLSFNLSSLRRKYNYSNWIYSSWNFFQEFFFML